MLEIAIICVKYRLNKHNKTHDRINWKLQLNFQRKTNHLHHPEHLRDRWTQSHSSKSAITISWWLRTFKQLIGCLSMPRCIVVTISITYTSINIVIYNGRALISIAILYTLAISISKRFIEPYKAKLSQTDEIDTDHITIITIYSSVATMAVILIFMDNQHQQTN